MRWLTNFYDCSNEQLQKQLDYILLKPDCHSWWISKMQSGREDTLEERYAIEFCFKPGKMPQKRIECFRLLFDQLAWIEHQLLSGIRHSRKVGSLWEMMRRVRGVRKSIHQSWLAKGLGLLCWGFKGVQEEIPWEEVSGISTRTMHQSITPSLSQTIWLRLASTQFVTLPIFHTLLPVTFGYSLSSEAVVMKQLKIWKRLWRRSLIRWHKRTSMGPCRICWKGTTKALLPVEITGGLVFHVCTINKSAQTKKVWKLI